MFDWNDVRTFLAVARGGSTLAAAKTLKVNQTTVSRRLDALDEALGLKLFERSQSGTRLTEAGQALLADAEQLERAAEGLARTAAQHHRGLAGTIRVTTGDVMASIVLTPLLPEFRRLYPEVAIQLAITDAALDLAAGEADVAFRGAVSLEDSNLVARKVNVDDFGLYCSLAYVERHGLPTLETLGAHVLVAGEGPMDNMPGMRWMLAQAPGAEVAVRSSSMANVIQSVRAGLGVGPMPSLIGGADPDLIEIGPSIPEAQAATFIVTRADLKDTPRIRAFIDFMAPHLATIRRDLEAKAEAMKPQKAAALAAVLAARPA